MNKFAFSLLLGSGILLSNCTPQPQSCLRADKTSILSGESVGFTSCALDYKRVVWNFGDGSATSDSANINHTFSTPGTYLVEQKVLSKKDKKWDRSTLLITVSYPYQPQRYLTRIQLNSFATTNNGAAWDAIPASGPDVFISYGVDGSVSQFSTSQIQDLQLANCPVFWDFSPDLNKLLLTNQTWRIRIADNDGTLVQPASQTMSEFTINPATAAPAAPGKIELVSGEFKLEIDYLEL